MKNKRSRKRRQRRQAGFIFAAVVLLILAGLAAWRLKQGQADAPQTTETPEQEPEAERETGTEAEKPVPEKEEPEQEPEALSPEEEKAAFLPDYTSAPLLNTTQIKNLSVEVGATEDELRFNWFSPGASAGRVEWTNAATGEMQTFEAQCAASAALPGYYVNKAVVTGLSADASYTYRVGNEEAWSPQYTYQSPKDTGNAFTFLVTADAQIGQSQMEEISVTTERWDSVLTRLGKYVPEAEFMFHLGDQVADFGSAEHYDGFLDHLPLYRIPLAPVVGNHDVPNETTLEKNGHPAAPYFYEHFNVPNRSETAQTPYDKDGNYYFIRNNTLFIVLNSSAAVPGEVHEQYVAQIVSEHPEVKWKILVQHYPAYKGTTGSGKNDVKEYLARATIDNDIDLVLGAHDHAYSRTAFVNRQEETLNDYPYSSGDTVVNPEGTLYITCGTSSGVIYHPIEEEIRIVRQGAPEAPTALRIDITDTELRIRMYLVDTWTVFDEYTIQKK